MTVLITVLGVVQGVGYRPFAARLANELNITGTVMNSGGIVQIRATGCSKAINKFIKCLKECQPPGADVTQVLTEGQPEEHFEGFEIITSSHYFGEIPLIPADLPLCENCARELGDQQNRRYRYPFISCVACGPRYSIINALPYDRENTVMDIFPLCTECSREYRDSSDIRCHAQTISCHNCGPQLILKTKNETCYKETALSRGIELLKQRKVLAVKGIGGYQFACLPTDAGAVEKLRLLKQRDKKPFAVMFSNTDRIKEICEVNPAEESLLLSSARPIVLLKPKKNNFCGDVCCDSRFIGAFLAYTPLHRLLTDACGALVMTSGNVTNEPIIVRDEDIQSLESPHLGGILYSIRQIVTPLDDSVARVVCGKLQLIRRSRGYAPLPVMLKRSTAITILAMGVDLKSCFCLYQDDRAYLSQYFGDTENYQVSQVFQENLKRMTAIFTIDPDIIACDLHPNYFTSSFAEKMGMQSAKTLIKIQHHHAHAASVMAEHDLPSCVGVVFDGTGYGTDGAVWGGEFLLCKNSDFERCAHLGYVRLCGGDAAAKNAEILSYCYLNAAGETLDNNEFSIVEAALQNNINTTHSSSMGRLFDAVSALLGIKHENSFEGECAIALENAAVMCEMNGVHPYPLQFNILYNEDETVIDQVALIKDIYSAYKNGVDRGALALGFHKAVAEMVLNVCLYIRRESSENAAVLSGGVFANSILTKDCVELLENAGFNVYMNSAVPMNDGGISLGQAWLCGQMN